MVTQEGSSFKAYEAKKNLSNKKINFKPNGFLMDLIT